MPGYLEAYRLARAKSEEQQGPAAEETLENDKNGGSQSSGTDVKRETSSGHEAAARKPGAKAGTFIQPTIVSPKSFEAAKLRLDTNHGNKRAKDSKGSIRKWSSSIDPTSQEEIAAESAEKPTTTSAPVACPTNPKLNIAAIATSPPNTNAQSAPQPKEPRAANAPKRIVSDEHWLKDRSPPNDAPKSVSPLTGSPLFRETAVFARAGSKRPDAWVRRKSTPGKRNISTVEKKQVTFGGAANDFADGDADDGEAVVSPEPALEGKRNIVSSTPERKPVAEPEKTAWKGAWVRKRAPQPASYSSETSSEGEEESSEGPKNAPTKTLQSRLSSWLSQTPDPFVEKLEDPLTGDAKPVPLSEIGSLIGPRKTSARRKHRSSHRAARANSFDGARSPSQSDSEHSTHSGQAPKRSGAKRRAKSPTEKCEADKPSTGDIQLAPTRPRKFDPTQRDMPEVDVVANTGKPRRRTRKRPNPGRNLSSHADLISALSQPHGVKGLVSARTIRTSRKQIGNSTILDLMNELKSDEYKYMRDLETLIDGVIPVMLNSVLSQSNIAALGVEADDQASRDKAKHTIVGLGIAIERLHGAHEKLPTTETDEFMAWALRSISAYENYIAAWRLGFHDVVINLAPGESIKNLANNRASGDGERVDVAFLFKRPLIRLKYLTKTIKGIHHMQFGEEAASLATKYQALIDQARLKQERELARLEDEAASSIDANKIRDPETLAPMSGIRINRNRCVRARDVFEMKMRHSSGQRLDCQVMLFLRDDLSGYANRGDVLVAEMDSSSRWLLFPPAELPQLSARLGKSKRNLIVMLRGSSSVGQEWRELMSLMAENEGTASEWVKMLGSNPLPPTSIESKGFKDASAKLRSPYDALVLANADENKYPDPSDVDVPFGERSLVSFERRESVDPPEALRGDLAKPSGYLKRNHSAQIPPSDYDRVIRHSKDQFAAADHRGPVSSAPPSPRHPEAVEAERRSVIASSKVHSWLAGGVQASATDRRQSNDYADMDILRKGASQRRPPPTRLSTIPSESLPPVQRNREITSPPQGQSGSRLRQSGVPHGTTTDPEASPGNLRGVSTPVFSPKPQYSTPHRRSSSPLKHEYEPYSDSERSSVRGELPTDDEESITSESSIDDMVPDPKIPTVAMPNKPVRSTFAERYTPKGQDYTDSPSSLRPGTSQNERNSQAEHQAEPDQPVGAVKVIASIHTWSDKGMWKLLHPDECSIVVSPGLIEAFEMSAEHSAPTHGIGAEFKGRSRGAAVRPLVALELTPLVPLRQSTAIDITIRSPPTANSQLRASNNLMLRTRTGQECEYLYNLINQARIHNPTYIALQNARGPAGGSNWAAYMDQQASKRGGTSWWRLGSKKSSYRASQTRRSASLVETMSSVASMSSAISALKNFASGSNMFNVGKSTISSRGALSNEKSTASFESSSGSTTPVVVDPSKGAPAGLSDMKIRLYERETASKWRDMGSARLTIMHPPRGDATLISPTGHLKQERRVVITGMTHGETLLDVTLGETSFERVARTGVALKVWEQFEQMTKTGGVAGARMRVYMIQMKSEAEAAYTFSLVGRLRY